MIQLFHNLNIDWVSKTKYFVLGSLLALLTGGLSIASKRGLEYGIDFKGGTLVYVRFAQEPPIERIRAGLAERGLGDSSIQRIRDINNPGANEVVIGLPQPADQTKSLDAGKTTILEALESTFGAGDSSKPDLNAAGAPALAEILTRRDPLAKGSAVAEAYTQLARKIADFRDGKRGGLLTSFEELRAVEGASEPVIAALRDSHRLGAFAVRNVEIVGPKVGEQLQWQALWATLYALAGMLVYIAFRFEWVYGAAAVLAVLHDVLVTLGFFSIFGYEISLTVVAALLTLVGYSMNDTIVIFDRIRENLRSSRREPFAAVVNRSINQTLSRTFLTSGLTYITVLVLFLLGGQVLRGFSFALVVGVMVGTYSTVGIAASLIVAWYHWRGQQALVGSVTPAGESGARGRVAAAGRR